MKQLLVLAALAGLLGTQQCFAVMFVAQTPGYFSDSGGEFTITDPPDPLFEAIYGNYVPGLTQVNGGFQTFAIGVGPLPGPGVPLVATLGPAVGWQTAALYMEFAKGTLPGYDYINTSLSGRAGSASELQNAIWYFQDILTNPDGGSTYEAGLRFIQLVQPDVQLEVDQLQLTWSDANGPESMTVLALVGVPDSGATLMLLGLGLSSLGAFSRRFRA